MSGAWIYRRDAAMPHQTWVAFPPEAIVQIENAVGGSRIGPAEDFWWGYERELGKVGAGVIIRARRLDRPKS
jgi:hypothetical protein